MKMIQKELCVLGVVMCITGIVLSASAKETDNNISESVQMNQQENNEENLFKTIYENTAWVKRRYYRSNGELLVVFERVCNKEKNSCIERISPQNDTPRGTYVEYELDQDGRKTLGIEYFNDDDQATGNVIRCDYYYGNVSQITITSLINDNSSCYSYEYDQYNNITHKLSYQGENLVSDEQTENIYDEDGRLVKSVTKYANEEELLTVSEYEYDNVGHMIKEVQFDAAGDVSGYFEYEY